MKNLLFIGAGNMAEAIVNGLVSSHAPFRIRAVDVDAARLAHFLEKFGVEGSADLLPEVARADIVLLAVKPQQALEVLAAVAPAWTARHLLVSICAGLRSGKLESAAGAGARVVRVMPNTPSLVGLGAAAISRGAHATEEDLATARAILAATGITVTVPESDLDAVTAVSGSGPAYVFYLAEAMMASAIEMGLDPAVAGALVAQTVEGAGRMLNQTGLPPDELRRRVTSKGGTTAAAVAVLDGAFVRQHIQDALDAAVKRSRELAG